MLVLRSTNQPRTGCQRGREGSDAVEMQGRMHPEYIMKSLATCYLHLKCFQERVLPVRIRGDLCLVVSRGAAVVSTHHHALRCWTPF